MVLSASKLQHSCILSGPQIVRLHDTGSTWCNPVYMNRDKKVASLLIGKHRPFHKRTRFIFLSCHTHLKRGGGQERTQPQPNIQSDFFFGQPMSSNRPRIISTVARVNDDPL